MVSEAHSAALRAWTLDRDGELLASDLVRAELLRAVRRLDPGLVEQAVAVIEALDVVPLPRHLFRAAGLIDPPELGTLDALHLAVVLELGDDLEGLVTYDERLGAAARAHAVRVVAPA